MYEASLVPKNVIVTFRRRRCSGAAFTSVPLLYQVTTNVTSTPFAQVSPNNNTKVFIDWAAALSSGGSSSSTPPTNASTLTSLAQQITTDYVAWRSYLYSIVYNGVISPNIDATIDELVVCLYDKDITTLVKSSPYNSDPEELLHADAADNQCTDANNSGLPTDKYPWIEYYGPLPMCGGGGAQAYSTLNGDEVDEITLTDGGAGYASGAPPTVLFSECDGFGAEAIAMLDASGHITGIDVTNGGQGYTVPPLISFYSTTGNQLQMFRYKFTERNNHLIKCFVQVDDI